MARPGIVHRLDKDTTGLMVVAKTDRAHRSLAAQFADHGRTGPLERGYLALVWGVPDRAEGTIDAPLGRSTRNREKIEVKRAGGREAVTHYRVVERYGADGKPPVASLLECRLETGRTHQIRVHLAAIGHPVIGDRDLWRRASPPRPRSCRSRRAAWPRPSRARRCTPTCSASSTRSPARKCASRAALPADMAALAAALKSL